MGCTAMLVVRFGQNQWPSKHPRREVPWQGFSPHPGPTLVHGRVVGCNTSQDVFPGTYLFLVKTGHVTTGSHILHAGQRALVTAVAGDVS